jgi:hypothetical protein
MDQVLNIAEECTNIWNEFLMKEKKAMDAIRVSFHLRPVTKDITVVSTLPCAPMRGLNGVRIEDLKDLLPKLKNVISCKSEDKILEELDALGFKERINDSIREEDAQAFLIRDMIKNPVKYDGMQFVTSELNLPKINKRADVIGYKDGFLYDIELKNARDTYTITQAKGYTDHMNDNLDDFVTLLKDFPNCKLPNKIKGIKGIALVPYSDNTSGKLESMAKDNDIALWFFSNGFRIHREDFK